MPQFLSLLSVVIILGSLSFYFYALTTPVIWFLALVCLVLILKWRRTFNLQKFDFQWKSDFKILVFITIIAAAFYILFTHQTTDALRSPWESIPSYFFLLYGATVFITIILLGLLPFRQAQGRNDSTRGVTRGGGPPSSPSRSDATVGPMRSDGGVAWQDPEQSAAEGWSWLPITLLTFLTLSVSLIIFPLGSGFDPFIHQATEKIIAATGTITPKPLYYIGQYTLVVFLSKILGISVIWIDKLLVPLLAAIFLPWSIMSWLSGWGGDSGIVTERHMKPVRAWLRLWADRSWLNKSEQAAGAQRTFARDNPLAGPPLVTLSFLLLPFLLTPFTTTTPYSLALLFLVVLIFHVTHSTQHTTNLLLAFATFLIHPLAGIPAFIFLIVQYAQKHKNKLLHVTCYVLCALAIPAAFLVIAQFSSQIHIAFTPQNFLPWLQSLSWGGIYRENRFNAPLDLLYFYGFNIKNIYWFFVLTAIVLKIKQHRRSAASPPPTIAEVSMEESPSAGGGSRELECGCCGALTEGSRAEHGDLPRHRSVSSDGEAVERPLNTYFKTFLILLTSYVLMSGFLSFNFLIGYEQADYAKRILDIAQLFLLPLFFIGIHWWLSRIPRAATILILTLGITASLFLTYPQKIDSYSVSHAFNTSQADIDAVRWIDADAHGEDYIVLANQAVSAAAIRELGFKKYYTTAYRGQRTGDSVFFYPIPTGSPLYQYYLDMVYPPKVASQQLGGQVKNRMETIMQESKRLVGAQRAYFVLNRYWNDFNRIFAEAQENLRLLHSINPVRSRPAEGTTTAASGRPASNGVNNSVFIFSTK